MVSAICHNLTSKVVFMCRKIQKWYLSDTIGANVVVFCHFLHLLSQFQISKVINLTVNVPITIKCFQFAEVNEASFCHSWLTSKCLETI
jgi:hypothetical protein